MNDTSVFPKIQDEFQIAAELLGKTRRVRHYWQFLYLALAWGCIPAYHHERPKIHNSQTLNECVKKFKLAAQQTGIRLALGRHNTPRYLLGFFQETGARGIAFIGNHEQAIFLFAVYKYWRVKQ